MGATYFELLKAASQDLKAAGIDTAQLDARLLAKEVFGLEDIDLLRVKDIAVDNAAIKTYGAMIARRLQHEPVHRILGWREFWGLRFALSPDTLEPRPDSETLIETAQRHFTDKARPLNVLDIGTGTGCLLISFLSEYYNAMGTGTDIAAGAVNTAKANAETHNLANRCRFLQTHWAQDIDGSFEVIFSNPPYIESDGLQTLSAEVRQYDPLRALDGGADGLEAYRGLMPHIVRLLAPGGFAFIEIGSRQTEGVTRVAAQNNLSVHAVTHDLGGLPRCLTLFKP